jgi:4a-hydroxytetrahydrobiopterin dehydratase
MSRLLKDEEIDRHVDGLADWSRAESDGDTAITATFQLADFAAALAFVNAVGRLAEAAQHHPDIDIRWNQVTLVLSTHSEGGLTQADIELAHQISDESR